MKSIEQTLTATGYKIVIQTDIDCHLWMRWTTIKPQEHFTPTIKRGMVFNLKKYFCFDAYTDNEQEEAGDTTEHTFIKEPWPSCQTRFFYFHGEISGVASKSTTPIFEKHRVAPAEPTLIIDHDYPLLASNILFSNDWYGNTFMPPYDFRLSKIAVRHCQYGEDVCTLGRLDLREEPFADSVAPTLIETSITTLPALPRHPLSVFVEYNFSNQLVLAGVRYSFFAIGCTTRYSQPYYRLVDGNATGPGAGCHRWRYRQWLTPPVMVPTRSQSVNCKIWGYPV